MITKEDIEERLRTLGRLYKDKKSEGTFASVSAWYDSPPPFKDLENHYGISLKGEEYEYFLSSLQFSFSYQELGSLVERKELNGHQYGQCQVADYLSFKEILYGDGEDFVFDFRDENKYENYFWDQNTPINVREELEKMLFWGQVGFSRYLFIDMIRFPEKPGIFLLQYPNQLSSMSLSLGEYVEKFLDARGLFGWEKHFTLDPISHPAIKDEFRKTWNHFWPSEPFPDFPELPPDEKGTNSFHELANEKRYGERFDKMVELLKANPDIEVVHYERKIGAPIPSLQKSWHASHGLLDDEMLAFFSVIGELKLLWRYKKGGQTIIDADFKIQKLEEIMGGNRPEYQFRFHWDNDVNLERGWDQPETKSMRLFSISPYGDTVLKFNKKKGKVELFVLEEDRPVPLQVTFGEYVERMLECGGMSPFPFFLTNPVHYKQLGGVARFRINLKRLFPHAEGSHFRKK